MLVLEAPTVKELFSEEPRGTLELRVAEAAEAVVNVVPAGVVPEIEYATEAVPAAPTSNTWPEAGAVIERVGRPTTVKVEDAEVVPPRLFVSEAARV